MEIVDISVKDCSIIVGQAHFIKTVEDLYEAIVNVNPNIEFGIAFCEASGKRLIRHIGNSDEMIKHAIEIAKKVGAGHSFYIVFKNGWPINILNSIKQVPEVVGIYAATSNPLKLIVLEHEDQRAIIGVLDGHKPLGVEGDQEKKERHSLLRNLKYKW